MIKRFCWSSLAIIVLLSLSFTGLAACSPQNPQADAASVVQRYLEAKKANDYQTWKSTLWAAQNGQAFTPSFEKPGDLGVINLTIGSIAVSESETQRIQKMYTGSDLAKSYGWSDEFITQNMVAVSAQYTVDYDNTKVPYPEGTLNQFFYLVRNNPSSPWLIWDTSFTSN